MDRFVVVHSSEAIKNGYPDDQGTLHHLNRWHEAAFCLYETDGEKPIRFVASDGGEPEDQLLVRDWSWVADELNKLAKEVEDARNANPVGVPTPR